MLVKTILLPFFLATAVHAESVKEAVVNMCNENNVNNYVEQVRVLIDEYAVCHPKTNNIKTLEQMVAELNESRNGTVDEVAKNICVQVTQTNACWSKYLHAVQPCTSNNLQEVSFYVNVTTRIINYICYEEDGKTRLAKFVDDGGIRCFTSRAEKFSRCYSYSSRVMKDYIENMLRCVIEELQACSNPAAILAQRMSDYIHNNLPNPATATTNQQS